MKEKKIFLKPASENLIVREPKTKIQIPNEGAWILLSGPQAKYWIRRINDGSLIVVKPTTELTVEPIEEPSSAINKKTKKNLE